jgi:hypothetical protein
MRLAVITTLMFATLSACGGSGSGSPSPAASTPSGAVALASPSLTPAPRTQRLMAATVAGS